jgi:hypothetical protein
LKGGGGEGKAEMKEACTSPLFGAHREGGSKYRFSEEPRPVFLTSEFERLGENVLIVLLVLSLFGGI